MPVHTNWKMISICYDPFHHYVVNHADGSDVSNYTGNVSKKPLRKHFINSQIYVWIRTPITPQFGCRGFTSRRKSRESPKVATELPHQWFIFHLILLTRDAMRATGSQALSAAPGTASTQQHGHCMVQPCGTRSFRIGSYWRAKKASEKKRSWYSL